ncbi:MAG TPA: outer membrane beta-barrel family protein [Sphingomicrobium sp.]|nr:outer membrane beta-barrel family protein [Sphingomicrobium sp.]
MPSIALAQDIAPSTSKSQQSVRPGAIVVTGTRPYTQNLIDRKVYNVSKDLQSGSGSAADVLKNIPSVDVDAQGGVSVRGDTNVQILIDGKPSTTMSSATRADALEQLSASSIDHIEVITTPGAQYKADASGGIINIVTKRNPSAGASGNVHASAGTDGSFALDGTGTGHTGRWTVSGNIGLRRDVRWRPSSDHRLELDPSGQPTSVEQDALFSGPRLARTVAGTIDYDATSRDRLSAHGSYTRRTGTPRLDQTTIVEDAAGLPTTEYRRYATGHEDEVDSDASASYRHQFAAKDHQFTLTLRRGESVENENRLFHSFYDIPAGVQEIDEQFPRSDELQREVTAEYARPIGKGTLLAGYDREKDDDDYLNRGIFIDPVTLATTIDPTRSNRFHYRQIVDAGYVNYDGSFGTKLAMTAGLRLEATTIATNEIDVRLRHHSSYLRAYPSAHLEFDIADREKLRLGYSRRTVRPDPEDLNPYPVFSDPLSERTGNPNLKPEQIDAVEASYERASKLGSVNVTAFLRRTANEFTVISRLISPTVILTTHENLGSSTALGAEASAQGKLSRAVAYRLSGSLYRDEINASNLGYLQERADVVADAKAGLDVNLTKRDLLQVNANYRGKRLTAQGYRLSSFVTDIGIRHDFPNHMAATLAVSDLFDSRRDRIFLTALNLQETIVRRNGGRRISLALTLPFGGSEPAKEKSVLPSADDNSRAD